MVTCVDTGGAAFTPRVVPGVGRSAVAADEPALVELMYQATQNAAAIGVLADWLRDRDDDRADLVADLATPGVVPAGDVGPDDVVPLVAGREWGAVRRAAGVRGRVYPGTALAAAIEDSSGADTGDWDDSPHRFEHRLPRERRTPAGARTSLDCCRCRFLFAAFGTCRLQVMNLRNLRNYTGVARVSRLLRWVPKTTGAQWLHGLRTSDPARFAAVMADECMTYVLRHRAYSSIFAPVSGAEGAVQGT